MSSFAIDIVGGGLAGALLANGLIKNCIDMTVYERAPGASGKGEHQVRLGQYSLNAFRLCLDPERVSAIEQKFGVSAAQDSHSIYIAPSIYPTSFESVIDLGGLRSYSTSTAIDRVILRDFLVGPLNNHRNIKFDQEFTRYEIFSARNPDKKMRLHFAGGATGSCDRLIGADGSTSKVTLITSIR